jgi:hypothetical protein
MAGDFLISNDPKGKWHIPFDYGFYDQLNNYWRHADNGGPSMKAKASTLEVFSKKLINFDTQVFCVTCENWKFEK